MLMVRELTSARSAVPSPTTLLPGPVGCDPYGPLTPINPPILPQILPYHDFSNSIIYQASLMNADADSPEDLFLRIVHPYDIDAFDHFLSKNDLAYFYPLLVMNLRNGFPLGAMPALTHTIIFNNHPSTHLYSNVIDKYLTDELITGRMSGPFSLQQVEKILWGAIFCSPLLVSAHTQQPGMPDKL